MTTTRCPAQAATCLLGTGTTIVIVGRTLDFDTTYVHVPHTHHAVLL